MANTLAYDDLATINKFGGKKFYGTRSLSYEKFYGRNLRIFVISFIVISWQAFPA
jgi:hypothetical protein